MHLDTNMQEFMLVQYAGTVLLLNNNDNIALKKTCAGVHVCTHMCGCVCVCVLLSCGEEGLLFVSSFFRML